jgi:hypothetical protein
MYQMRTAPWVPKSKSTIKWRKDGVWPSESRFMEKMMGKTIRYVNVRPLESEDLCTMHITFEDDTKVVFRLIDCDLDKPKVVHQ